MIHKERGKDMKCFYHEERNAVATCKECGKALCKECASKHSPVYCDECFSRLTAESKNRKEQQKQANILESKKELTNILIKGAISAIIFGVLIFGFQHNAPNFTIGKFIGSMFFAFCFPFGWKALSRVPIFYGRTEETMMRAMVYNILRYAAAVLVGIPAFVAIFVPAIIKLSNASKQ